ncbi:hypothetical protein HPB49_011841 [Dermacentor silvarum]|uniref:Uncharacterized protein n=1 Tax=Dermacentor silvarum TaxID=543639 RepID=A0ACB8DZW5_DERSI|nr:hypothetical protein HPB49_011841 [Dermacentor silvarum]
MAKPEVLTALRQQQQHSRNASTTEAVPAGSAEDVTAPTEGIPHAASYDTWRVAIKLLPFWVDSPEVWFTQVEAHFSLARLTQHRTRYDYVVTHLDAHYFNENRRYDNFSPQSLPSANLRSSCTTCVRSRATCKSRILSCERFGSNDSRPQVRLALNKLAEISDRVEAFWPQLSPTIQAVAAPLNTTELARGIDDID